MNRQTVHDVVVVGAGPAGLTAAADLARAGHDVSVLEEHEHVGRPVHCTGVLGYQAFDELDLPRKTILSITGAASFRHNDGPPVMVDTDRVLAAVIDRAAFDDALATRAREAGASIRRGSRVEKLQIDAAGVTATVRGGTAPVRPCLRAGVRRQYRSTGARARVPRAFVQTAQLEMPFPALSRIDAVRTPGRARRVRLGLCRFTAAT